MGLQGIRYNQAGAIDFLLRMFPRASLVFVDRDPGDTFLSALLAQWSEPVELDMLDPASGRPRTDPGQRPLNQAATGVDRFSCRLA